MDNNNEKNIGIEMCNVNMDNLSDEKESNDNNDDINEQESTTANQRQQVNNDNSETVN